MTEESKRKDSFLENYPADSTIFSEGDSGKQMYVIRSGRVRIYRKAGDTELTLAILGPGESFGEMALIDHAERSAGAVAIEDSKVVVVGESSFEHMLKDRPDIAVRLLRELSARLREANHQIKLLTVHGSAALVVETLRKWSKDRQEEGEVFLKGVTPDELWRATGTSREVFGEILHRLGEAGIARFTGDGLLVSWPQGLQEYLEYLDLKRSFDPATTQELAALGQRQAQVASEEEVFHSPIGPDPNRRTTYKRFLSLKERFEK